MIYKFKQGHTLRGIDAQTLGDELERIRNANDGRLSTKSVLEWAAEDDCPIHRCFTWDNEKAAEQFRLSEARMLIKSVVVVNPDTETEAPAFWNVSIKTSAAKHASQDDRYYQSASVIASSPREFQAALNGMVSELTSARKGIEDLVALAPRGDKRGVREASRHMRSATDALEDLIDSA